jgi:hypothetical protein
MEALYHIKPYFVVIFHYIGLIYGRYLHFRILKFPLIYVFYFFSAMSDPIRDVPGSKGKKHAWLRKTYPHWTTIVLYSGYIIQTAKKNVYLGYFYIVIPSISQNMPKYIRIYIYVIIYVRLWLRGDFLPGYPQIIQTSTIWTGFGKCPMDWGFVSHHQNKYQLEIISRIIPRFPISLYVCWLKTVSQSYGAHHNPQ